MDSGIELPKSLHFDDLDLDDDDDHDGVELHIVDHPVVRRQNTCFLLALVSCVVAFAVYVVTHVYSINEVYSPDQRQEPGSFGIKNIDTAVLHHHNKGHHHTKGNKDYLATKKKIDAWHNKTVTLQDGVQYKILDQLEHDNKAFIEGLTLVNGRLFESVGLYQESELRELDPNTGSVLQTWPMEQQYFAEGLTYVDGRLLQLTYKKKTGFIYNFDNISAPPETFTFQTTTGEGWGMTYDKTRHEIIVSDGSDLLLFWDPTTLQEKRRIKVQRQFNRNARYINELEYWRDRVLANVWFEDTILVIHPETGVVEKEYGECGGGV